jgi:hypothetical protein
MSKTVAGLERNAPQNTIPSTPATSKTVTISLLFGNAASAAMEIVSIPGAGQKVGEDVGHPLGRLEGIALGAAVVGSLVGAWNAMGSKLRIGDGSIEGRALGLTEGYFVGSWLGFLLGAHEG